MENAGLGSTGSAAAHLRRGHCSRRYVKDCILLKLTEGSAERDVSGKYKGEHSMRKKILSMLAASLLFCSLVVACSSSKDAGTEKGAIDRMTDRAAKEMADSIQIPLERARAAAQVQEEKMRQLEEAMKDK